ncbi:MAG: alpha-L-rhamnosidase N-terminal domain-containing protein [Opitutae bacterium]|nr:alpha-L-rhamnosidase N-terminal domain-containing protein [Opitutae bacterium]
MNKMITWVVSLLLASTVLGESSWKASWIGVPAPEGAHEVVIQQARYGVSGDSAKQVDVTEKLRAIVRSGKYTVESSNAIAGGDPAYGKEKTLELEYTVNGTAQKKSIPEKESIHLVLGKAEAFRDTAPPAGANQWICFRKNIRLDEKPRHAVARISADSKYWLWVNGELVILEGQLKRGPTPNDTYFDRVDLTNYLQKGDNTIAVLLWYFGKTGFSHNSSGKAGLLFDADVDGNPVVSDASWKAMAHPAYGSTSAPYPNFRMPESYVRFDARNDVADWNTSRFDDSAWPTALHYGAAPCAPWNQLVERPIPQWKDFGLKPYANADALPKISDGRVIKAKLPYNAQVTPYFEIEGPAGETIDIRMDNGASGRSEYVTQAGRQSHEELAWQNGHEVHYTIPAGFKILALKYRETGYDTEFAGSFECDDAFFNRHHKKALRTLYINMRDTYMDCPDRERAQWWGDVVNQLGQAFYALDSNSYALARKGMLELVNWQRENHTLFAPIPGNWTGELKLQMLNSVGYYGFWTYYLYSGDLETLRAVYPGVRRYLSIWNVGQDGLVVSRGGSWTDWGENKDFAVLNNGWYYLALKGQLNMAQVLGEQKDVAAIQAKMTQMEQGFNKAFWTGSEYRSADYKELTDDRAQALAVLCGFAQPDQYDAIRKVFQEQAHCSPYMEKYVGEALYHMRLPEDALSRTKQRFKVMTDHPYTTLWETFPKGGTMNHAWSGGALTLLAQYGAGVAPVTPGYGMYHVLPQMGHLKQMKLRVPSVKGPIDLELQNEAGVFTLKLNSPADTTAIVGIPKCAGLGRIQANGKTIWSKGQPTGNLTGLTFQEATTHYIQFSVQPGSWEFQAK